MSRIIAMVIMLALGGCALVPVPAAAQTAAEVAVCAPYAKRYCRGVALDEHMIQCLQAHRAKLGVLCRAALAAHGY